MTKQPELLRMLVYCMYLWKNEGYIREQCCVCVRVCVDTCVFICVHVCGDMKTMC